MAESENHLPNELCAAVPSADTGGAQSRRIRIHFEGPAPCPVEAPDATPDGDQFLKATLDACKSSKWKRIADNGMQASCDASNENRMLPSNKLMSSEQEVECDGGSINLLSGFGEQTQFGVDTLSRLMRCNTATEGRMRSQSSLGSPTSIQLKKSKRPSSTERRPSSIDDLPNLVLVEILSRLPCSKLVFQCKSVSKRWLILITDPYFIGRFVHIQSYKKTPLIRTLINDEGEEFPPKMPSSPKLLTPVLKRIMSFHHLITEPVVVATYNDLVLCCATEDYQRDYYICNAYTKQWVALPPIPGRCHESVLVGLICNTPDCNCEKDDWKGHNIQLNDDCRCWVVRILPPDEFANDKECDSFDLNVEIFSSETGEWRELVVSSPQRFDFDDLDEFCFAYNGMLYWAGDEFSFIGLGPFNDYKSTSSSSSYGNGIIDDRLRLTVFQERLAEHYGVEYLGVHGGCVRMCDFIPDTRNLYIWELEEQDHDQAVDGATGKLCLSKRMVYPLDPKMYLGNPLECNMEAFDPNNKDILYLRVEEDIIKCDIRTRKWSKIVENCPVESGYYFPVVLPLWPTPIPRLP